MIDSSPKFIQGVLPFNGAGYATATPMPALAYTVPSDKRAQLVYLRAGNSTDAMIVVSLLRNGAAMRLFAVGAKDGTHVPLVVVEDIQPDEVVSVSIAAPEGVSGTVMIDIGMVEI